MDAAPEDVPPEIAEFLEAAPDEPLPVSVLLRQASGEYIAQAEDEAKSSGVLLPAEMAYAAAGERVTPASFQQRLDGLTAGEARTPANLLQDAQMQQLHHTPELVLNGETLQNHVTNAVAAEIAKEANAASEMIAAGEAANVRLAGAAAAAYVEALAAAWETLETDGGKSQSNSGPHAPALAEETGLVLLQSGQRELYAQFMDARKDAPGPEPSAWHKGRILAQEALARGVVAEARANEIAFELTLERTAFAVEPEIAAFTPAAFNQLRTAAAAQRETQALAPEKETATVKWSLTDVQAARETWAKARQLAEIFADQEANQQMAAHERLNHTLQSLLTPQHPLEQLQNHFLGEAPGDEPGTTKLSLTQGFLNHLDPARRLETHPLAQIGQALYAEAKAARNIVGLQTEIAAKQAALERIEQAVREAAQAVREDLARVTGEAGEKHQLLKDEVDSLRAGGTIQLPDSPIFVGNERELLGTRALRIGDAEGVRQYQREMIADAKHLEAATAQMGHIAEAVSWNPARPPLPLDHKTAKAFSDLMKMPPSAEQVAAGAVKAGAVKADTANYLEAQISLARESHNPRLLVDAIAARRDSYTRGEVLRLPEAAARLEGQIVVAEALAAQRQVNFAERFAARFAPRFNAPDLRLAPPIERETLQIKRWFTPAGTEAGPEDLLNQALDENATPLTAQYDLVKFSDAVKQTPELASAAAARINLLTNLAEQQKQAYANTKNALLQVREEAQLTATPTPLITAGDLATGLTASAQMPYHDQSGEAGAGYRNWQKQLNGAEVKDLTPEPDGLRQNLNGEVLLPEEESRPADEASATQLAETAEVAKAAAAPARNKIVELVMDL